ncbi:MAG TPA: sigma factor [Acidimicrobiales bacterium]|nr:sigma factor [Acidimicrobiales bacterium]
MAEDEEFSRFMADRYGALVRTAFLLTADRGHAEDLAQASLIRTFQAWGRLHDTAAAETYTRTVMARLAIRWGRRRWRAEQATPHLDRLAVIDAAGKVDDADLVKRCLAALPGPSAPCSSCATSSIEARPRSPPSSAVRRAP